VCTKGKKVKASEAALLKKLNFKPFEYGMKVLSVYDEGSILPEEVLNLNPATLLSKFSEGARNIVGLSLEAGYPIAATIPVMITNAFKNLAALSIESGYFMINLDSRSRKLRVPPQVDLLPKLK
jgi:large subunit ribosomal protein LP0